MIDLNPSLLVAAANAFVGLGEDGGDNRGQMVEHFLSEVRQPPGQPWCAAFVYHVGYWSHYDHRDAASSWPLPATASCWELGEFARVRAVLRKEPTAGDVFLLYVSSLKRFAHTGIIVGVQSRQEAPGDVIYSCTTVEGNTNADGSREGTMTLRKTRRFSLKNGDRFIRWPDLRAHAQAA
jgi:hypothetical protein